jgi:hypothetical protein
MTYQCDPCVCPEQHYRDNGTFKKAVITLLCDSITVINEIVIALGGAPIVAVNATFDALTPVASAAIGGAYASAVVLPANTRQVILDNQTNGDVYVSMDGGTSDNYHMTPGGKQIFNLADLGLITGADVQLKDGISPSTAGTFFVYSIL